MMVLLLSRSLGLNTRPQVVIGMRFHTRNISTHNTSRTISGSSRSILPKRRQYQPLPSFQKRSLARISTPRFQVPVHIALFTLLVVPTVGFSLFYAARYGPTEEELEQTIRERYSATTMQQHNIIEKNAHVGTFLQQAYGEGGQNSEATQARLQAVLHGGRSDKGRQRQFDSTVEQERDDWERRKKEEEKLRERRLRLGISDDEEEESALRSKSAEDGEKKKKKRKRRKKKKKTKAEKEAEEKAAKEKELQQQRLVTVGAASAVVIGLTYVVSLAMGGSKK